MSGQDARLTMTPSLVYYHVDVFSARPFMGNSLTVFIDEQERRDLFANMFITWKIYRETENMMNRQGWNSPEIEAPVGPFSHVVRAGDLLYLSGQTGQRSHTGALIGDNVAEQTTQIFENINVVLRTVNGDLSHIIKVTVFLTDMADFAAMNAVYARYFDPPYPARSTIAVKALPLGALVEVECIAKVENEKQSPAQSRK